jgi:gliding motility-associated-like protein
VNSGSICETQIFTVVPAGANTYTITGGSFTMSPITPINTFSVSGTGTNGCVSNSVAVSTLSVYINPTITAASGSICAGQSFTINPSGGNTYTYSSGNAVITPSATNSYSVSGTNTFGCVSLSPAVISVTVNPNPTISVNSGSICAGQDFTITPSGAATYSITGNTFVVTPSITTIYTVNGTSAQGCTNLTVSLSQVTVYALPTVSANISNAVVCAGKTIALSGAGANTYTWNNQVMDGVAFTPTAGLTYSVIGEDLMGCRNSATVSSTVNPLPNIQISSSSSTSCRGESVSINVNGANSYTWNTGINSASIQIAPWNSVTYSISGTNTLNCVNNAIFTQNVVDCNSGITVTTQQTNVSCRGKNNGSIYILSQLTYSNHTIEHRWSPGYVCATNTCDSIKHLKKGQYKLTMLVNSTVSATYVRHDTLTYSFDILDENDPCDIIVYKGITANSDGINDVFEVENIQLETYQNNTVQIFNRWGQLITEIKGYNNSSKSWPNKDELGKLESGTYFYVIDLGDGSPLLKNWIELIKN